MDGKPGGAAAQLVLQHYLWEPHHVRGQTQDADVPKIFGIPLQPAVCPALEAQKKCQQWALLLSGLPRSPRSPTNHFPGGRLDRVWGWDKRGWGR